MSNPILKTYLNYHEMIYDFASLSPVIDAEKTLTDAPPMSFYKTDGSIALGGSFINFLIRLREEAGILVNPFGSEEHRGYLLVSFEDYTPAVLEEKESIEIKPVDSPAKKRSQRNTVKK